MNLISLLLYKVIDKRVKSVGISLSVDWFTLCVTDFLIFPGMNQNVLLGLCSFLAFLL